MDTARQLVRWALPGWVGSLFWVIFVAINLFLQNHQQQLTLQDNTFLSTVRSLIAPLGVASVPIGFIIYQSYYWIYWHARLPSFCRLVINSNDRSQAILRDIPINLEELFGRPLIKNENIVTAYPGKWLGLRKSEIMQIYQENWALAQSTWHLALSDKRYNPIANFLEKRVQFLADIYHSLGACGIAIIIAYCFYLGYAGTILSGVGVKDILTNFALLVWIGMIFKKGRRDSFQAYTSLMHDMIHDSVQLHKIMWQSLDADE